MEIAKECVCCGGKNLKSSTAILMPFISHRVFNWRPVRIDESWGLRTIQAGVAYAVCNSLLCSSCHHLFLDMRFNDEEMKNLYQGYRETEYIEIRDHYEPGYKAKNEQLHKGYNYIDKIEEFLTPYVNQESKILDWGGDSGINTPFKQKNEVIHIYDISDREVIEGAKRVSKNEIEGKKYDLLICSNVLEHTPYPIEVLKEVCQYMSEKSTLYIEVPYENLVRTTEAKDQLHLNKKHWHEHINFYNENSMKKLVESSGMKVVNIRALPITGETSAFVFQVACQLSS